VTSYRVGFLLLGLVVFALITNGFKQRFSVLVGESGFLNQSSEVRINLGIARPNVSIIGDSLAGQFGFATAKLDVPIELHYRLSCPFLSFGHAVLDEGCAQFWVNTFDHMIESSPEKVIIASYFEDLKTSDVRALGASLISIEKKLKSAGVVEIIWIIQTADIDYSCELRKYHAIESIRPEECLNSSLRDQSLLGQLGSYVPDSQLFSPVDFFCNDSLTCLFVLEGRTVFSDNIHLSFTGSSRLLNVILVQK